MTLAPFGRRLLRVIKNERIGAYNMIWVSDPDRTADPEGGQFYMLAAERDWGGAEGRPYLPRAFSFARCNDSAQRNSMSKCGSQTERARTKRYGGGRVTARCRWANSTWRSPRKSTNTMAGAPSN